MNLATAAAILALLKVSSGIEILSEHCHTIKADFARRQLSEWGSEAAFTSADGTANVPVLTVSEDGSEFTIDIEGATQVASDDPEVVHFLTHVYAEDQDGIVVYMHTFNPLSDGYPTQNSSMPAGITQLTPYTFNNRDGLWVGETVETGGTADTNRVIACGTEYSLQWVGGAWESVIADLERQQKDTYQSDVPFTETESPKHTPYISFDEAAGTAFVMVGSEESEIHPMNGSSDGITEPHWITEVWIVDDQGYTTTLKALDPTGVDHASLEFYPPEGSKTLTAYIWCNIHGLYVGPTVDVPAKNDGFVLVEDNDSGSSASFSVVAILAAALPVFFM